MNRKIILILSAAAAISLGAACVVLVSMLNTQRQRERAAAEAAAAEVVARVADAERLREAERERNRAEKQNKELADLAQRLRENESKQASNVSALAQQLKPSSTNADGSLAGAGGGQGMGEMLEKMMKDPAMKEMIRSQQKTMMKSMYGGLFKELNLSAEQQKQFSDLLLDSQMSVVESAGDLSKGEGEARTNAVNAIAEKQKATQAQIKALLGDENYAKYEDYQKTVQDRMVLSQFQQQAAGTETALRDEQMQGLIALIKEERARTSPVIDDDPSKTAENLQKVFNSELFEKQMQWQEDLNKRVLSRAGGLLTPEQLKEYAEFQESQYNMMRMGMKMAREMFKGKDAPR